VENAASWKVKGKTLKLESKFPEKGLMVHRGHSTVAKERQSWENLKGGEFILGHILSEAEVEFP
jgi:hypothetical protein